jgi:hypothetical protein
MVIMVGLCIWQLDTQMGLYKYNSRYEFCANQANDFLIKLIALNTVQNVHLVSLFNLSTRSLT